MTHWIHMRQLTEYELPLSLTHSGGAVRYRGNVNHATVWDITCFSVHRNVITVRGSLQVELEQRT